jgi:site-specific DNA-adenine methylase
MKHWTELNELESAIIRVGDFKNLFKLLVAGAENDVDIKVLQSAIYTMESMLDDIDSTLYDKFQTIFDAVRDDVDNDEQIWDGDDEAQYELFKEAQKKYCEEDNMNYSRSTTSYAYDPTTTSEEEEAFKDLEKAIKKWHKVAP